MAGRSGFRIRSRPIGRLIVSAIGSRSPPGAGPGWTTSPGALPRSTTAAGSMSTAAGGGCRVRCSPIRYMPRRWSPLSTRTRAAADVGWFPLGPDDGYVPWYAAGPAYVERVNNVTVVAADRGGAAWQGHYFNRQFATVVPRGAFAAGRPVALAMARIPPDRLAQAAVMHGAPPVAARPWHGRSRTRKPRAANRRGRRKTGDPKSRKTGRNTAERRSARGPKCRAARPAIPRRRAAILPPGGVSDAGAGVRRPRLSDDGRRNATGRRRVLRRRRRIAS